MRTRDFDLTLTSMSGQPLAFHSEYSDSNKIRFLKYSTSKGIIKIEWSGNSRSGELDYDYFGDYTAKAARAEIRKRFGLDANMGKVYSKISTDGFMREAIDKFHGLRVTENDPWETTMCFVISQFNNIKRIRGIVGNLTEKFGQTVEIEGRRGKLFPTPEAIASASMNELRSCGTGFRDTYLKAAANAFLANDTVKSIGSTDYGKAKSSLMEIEGVGDKVADCILLFGYGKFEAFPIDTWIKKTMESLYFKGKKTTVRNIHDAAYEKWGGMRGYAQQYLFWYGRETGFGGRLDA